MPTNRRKRMPRRRTDTTELTWEMRYHLEHGYGIFGDRLTREEFEDAWDEHGETILAEFIEENPGRRPFAWWLLEHGEERPVVAPWATAKEVESYRSANCRRDTFGFLHTSVWAGKKPGGGYWSLQEPEPFYLRRHGLLTAEEEEILADLWERGPCLYG